MTQSDFIAFYPQFAGFTPAVVLTEYIRQANARFTSFSEGDAEEARRLYVAHKLTMYARIAEDRFKKSRGGCCDVCVRRLLFFCINKYGYGRSDRNFVRYAVAGAD